MAETIAGLDADIAVGLRHLGVVAIGIEQITSLPSDVSVRAAFRLTLSDGRTLKARRLTTAVKARRYTDLTRLLRHLAVPEVLVRRGRVTIEEWIEGRPLQGLILSRGRLSKAADLIGSIHATPVGKDKLFARASTRPLIGRMHEQLEEVTARGALSRRESAAVRRAVRETAPAMACTGLTHNDFCGENLVEDGRGRVRVVDNGGLRPGFLDFDLARTRYRWPMPEASWRIFLAAYAKFRQPLPTAEEARFFGLAAVLGSVRFRLVRGNPEVEVPLRRLRALLAADGRKARPPCLRFVSSR